MARRILGHKTWPRFAITKPGGGTLPAVPEFRFTGSVQNQSAQPFTGSVDFSLMIGSFVIEAGGSPLGLFTVQPGATLNVSIARPVHTPLGRTGPVTAWCALYNNTGQEVTRLTSDTLANVT